ncbi:cell wall-binding protein, partial [Clostridium botulinum]|nr:cell wall-binding protein [Clostridium botulinum]
ITIFHVVFYKGNVAYVFTISELEKVSDQNMAAFKNMLNTVEFKI